MTKATDTATATETRMVPLHEVRSGDTIITGDEVRNVLRNAADRKQRYITYRTTDGERGTYVGHFNEVVAVVNS